MDTGNNTDVVSEDVPPTQLAAVGDTVTPPQPMAVGDSVADVVDNPNPTVQMATLVRIVQVLQVENLWRAQVLK